jgi:hypothetical protein
MHVNQINRISSQGFLDEPAVRVPSSQAFVLVDYSPRRRRWHQAAHHTRTLGGNDNGLVTGPGKSAVKKGQHLFRTANRIWTYRC